jgi:hypothetical protein
MRNKELRKSFIGIGEVRGFIFTQVIRNLKGYLYSVETSDDCVHYEVFRRKINKRFHTVTYPQSASFSRYAWTYSDYNDALTKFNEL